MIRAFLSHSSKDKESYVRIVANNLGKDNIEYDEITFEEGCKTIEEILRGLDQTQLFVFFISQASLESEWVKKEILAVEKILEKDLRKKIYPIIIDDTNYSDGRIPQWMRDEYNLKKISRPSVAARRIHGKLRQISLAHHPKLDERKKLFIGRNDKLEEFEIRIDDHELPKPNCIFTSGLQSIGRRTFLKNALSKTHAVRESYVFPTIYLDRNDSIEDFILKLNDLGLIDLGAGLENLLEKDIEDKKKIVVKLLKSVCDNDEIILILDNGCVVDYRGEVAAWFYESIVSSKIPNHIILCVASRRNLKFNRKYNYDHIFCISIPEFTVSERKRLFSKLLEIEDISLTRDDFEYFAAQLTGFPDQILFCVSLISELKLHQAKKESFQLAEFNEEKVSKFIKDYEDDKEIYLLIVLLSQFDLISLDFVFDILDENKYFPIIDNLVVENIAEYFGNEGEFIRINDAIKDYVSRNLIELPHEINDKIRKHVENFLQDENIFERDSSDYLYSIKLALADSDHIDKKLLIPSHFLRCMKDIYRNRKDYHRVVKLADWVLENEENIDKKVVDDLRYYLCLALSRLRDKRLPHEVQKIHGPEHDFLLGFYYRLTGRNRSALERLEPLINEPYISIRAKRELVQVYLQIDEYELALKYARENYLRQKYNPFNIQAYFDCLLHVGTDIEESERQQILKTLCDELKSLDGDTAKQMSMIADANYKSKYESYDDAKDIIEECILSYPREIYPYLANFDMAFHNKDVESMVKAIENINNAVSKGLTFSKKTLLKQKAIVLAFENKKEEAKAYIENNSRDFSDKEKDKVLHLIESI